MHYPIQLFIFDVCNSRSLRIILDPYTRAVVAEAQEELTNVLFKIKIRVQLSLWSSCSFTATSYVVNFARDEENDKKIQNLPLRHFLRKLVRVVQRVIFLWWLHHVRETNDKWHARNDLLRQILALEITKTVSSTHVGPGKCSEGFWFMCQETPFLDKRRGEGFLFSDFTAATKKK